MNAAFDKSFDERLVVRLFAHDLERLEEIVASSGGRYENPSHAVRAAIQFFIRKKGDI